MKDESLVSVIIPVYNGDRYLAEAIESAIAQTYQPMEIIAIDDGSTDITAEIAKSYAPAVRYIYQPNSGTAAARNQGIKVANGEYLAFLDADDIWLPNKLKIQMMAFEADSHLDIVTGYVEQFISPELNLEVVKEIDYSANLMPGYIPTAMVIKRQSFFRLGWFDERYQGAEFISWYVQAYEQSFEINVLPDVVAKRRLHQTNNGIVNSSYKKDMIKILKASLERRRTIKANLG
jgi:glycosyltransferase involved in cell wall biosynthesis